MFDGTGSSHAGSSKKGFVTGSLRNKVWHAPSEYLVEHNNVSELIFCTTHPQLIPIGFYDAPTCVVSMNVVRDSFVLLGDLHKSVQLLRRLDLVTIVRSIFIISIYI
jgi:hypothetical protein